MTTWGIKLQCMTKSLLFSFLLFSYYAAKAVNISGRVMDESGQPLPFATILLKNTTRGVTANGDGKFIIDLPAGDQILIAQYIGYEKKEQLIHVAHTPLQIEFKLPLLQVSLKEVIVKPGAEDPAYEIIRNAIAQRKEYVSPLQAFTCEAYIKTLVRTKKLPAKVMGRKISPQDKSAMGIDSAGKGILFLSESITKVAFQKPSKLKLEVVSGRQSGTGGFGFNFPTFINFYENNVKIFTDRLNPRGFVSPIAENALLFYKFRFIGSYWEDGREVNQIKVIPKRKYEPLFSGTIYITEGDWRISGVDLLVTKQSQLEIFDSIRIRQTHNPLDKKVWRIQDQSLTFSFKQLGIDAEGFLVNTYRKYDTSPVFEKGYFDRVIMKYDTSANKKNKAYWDSIRPVQLEPEEVQNFLQRDSALLERRKNAPQRNRDSLLNKQGPITLSQLFWKGFRRSNFDSTRPLRYGWEGLIKQMEYNTVEGCVLQTSGYLERKISSKIQLRVEPFLRYGFSSDRVYAWGNLIFSKAIKTSSWEPRKESDQWSLSGGHTVQQFNSESGVTPLMNSFQSLLYKNNFIKIYDRKFLKIQYAHRTASDIKIKSAINWEERSPLENTTSFTFSKRERSFTPNYPTAQLNENIVAHQALTGMLEVQYRPGVRFIQYPSVKVPLASKYPTLSMSMKGGIPKVLNSDVNYLQWKLAIWDDISLKLWGRFSYRTSIGGFLYKKHLYLPDYQHFHENQILMASPYVNSFQMAPYYSLSTNSTFYSTIHAEHHFNGMLTNKIPLFKKLNWHLVGSVNAYFAAGGRRYKEAGLGLENLFKVMRVDVLWSRSLEGKLITGCRVGFDGLIGSGLKITR